MIPAKTLDLLGATEWKRFERFENFALTGAQLNELLALAIRFNFKWDDPNEARDWQNRLNEIIGSAVGPL